MAFTATYREYPGNVRLSGGYVMRKWRCVNTAGSTGGTVDSGFAHILQANFETTSHVGATAAQIDKTGQPDIVLTVDANVDGDLTVIGRGVA